MILKSIPITIEDHYGLSHVKEEEEQKGLHSLSRLDYLNMKTVDSEQIHQLVEVLFT